MVLLISAILLTAVAASFQTTLTQVNLSRRSHSFLQSFGLAEAGIERGFLKVGQSPSFKGVLPVESVNGIGDFRTSVTATAGGWIIEATGYVPKYTSNDKDPTVMRRTLRATVRQGDSISLFKWGLFGYQHVHLDNAFTMSSWDITAYGEIPSAVNKHHTFGNIGSPVEVSVDNGSKIYGSIQSPVIEGPKKPVQGDNPDGQPNALIYKAPDVPDEFPYELFEAAKASNDNATGFRCSDPSYQPYNPSTKKLTLSRGNITVQPGTYYLAGIEVTGNNAEIKIEPAGQVVLYLDGDVVLDNHAQVNADGPSKNLMVFQKKGNISFDNGCTVHAAILSHRESEVSFGNTVDYFGSLVAGYIDIGNAKMFVFDEEMTKGGNVIPGGNLVTAWMEVAP
jgi:hypothetical protein